MGKTYEIRKAPRNNVAAGMIAAGTGKGGPMKDRRDRRSKDARRSWKREWEQGYTLLEVVNAFSIIVCLGVVGIVMCMACETFIKAW